MKPRKLSTHVYMYTHVSYAKMYEIKLSAMHVFASVAFV